MNLFFKIDRHLVVGFFLGLISLLIFSVFLEDSLNKSLADFLPYYFLNSSAFQLILKLSVSIVFYVALIRLWQRFFDRTSRCWRAFDKNDFETVIKLATPMAQKGQVDMQWVLGVTYGNDEYALHNTEQAIEWLVLAANQGHEFAQISLGEIYDLGRNNVPPSYEESLKWYEMASKGGLYTENGLETAQLFLGLKKLNAGGTARDVNGAINAFKLAAGQGNLQAMGILGALYFDGDLCPQNYEESLKYLTRASDQGGLNGWPEAVIGLIYERGLGLPVNYQEAFKWYKLGVEAGDDDAMNCLAGMYYYGYGVIKDEQEAARLFGLAAGLGNQDAILNLEMAKTNNAPEGYRFALKQQQKKMNEKIERENLSMNNVVSFSRRK